ncbi:Hemolysin precursor [Kluyvera cryocrescens]|uniref:Hemolysin n=1 Tax=Kluyvera cryocrescens TaxID=580 RepID=A0A485C9J5_KLUCR|nr:Hemolysin precursor [Kluyvera cryocrescens]
MKTLKAGKTLFKLSAMSLAVGLGLGAIAQASAAVVVDGRKSPDTKVTIADTGATVVNISGASSGGVSHNTFTQFDIDPTGVILNNSSTGSSTTLGGDIAGNSNMSGGSATVILNEVNSRDPSQLNGMVEVAGQQAAVVIANPSGISCDGCGFINASRSTLVTGTAEMSNGELTGFNVNDGQVVITGKGMDDRSTGYTDIISRSVKVNAQLQAQDLRIVTGSNHVDYATLATRGISSSVFSKPSLAVDVSSLGGMYANKIQLIGTEDGVGVRNNGTISASDTLSLSTKGKLENNGLIAGGEVAIDTHKNTLDNDHGTLQAERALTINSGNIDNNVDGAIVSQRHPHYRYPRAVAG